MSAPCSRGGVPPHIHWDETLLRGNPLTLPTLYTTRDDLALASMSKVRPLCVGRPRLPAPLPLARIGPVAHPSHGPASWQVADARFDVSEPPSPDPPSVFRMPPANQHMKGRSAAGTAANHRAPLTGCRGSAGSTQIVISALRPLRCLSSGAISSGSGARGSPGPPPPWSSGKGGYGEIETPRYE